MARYAFASVTWICGYRRAPKYIPIGEDGAFIFATVSASICSFPWTTNKLFPHRKLLKRCPRNLLLKRSVRIPDFAAAVIAVRWFFAKSCPNSIARDLNWARRANSQPNQETAHKSGFRDTCERAPAALLPCEGLGRSCGLIIGAAGFCQTAAACVLVGSISMRPLK